MNLKQLRNDWENVDTQYKEDVFDFMSDNFEELLETAEKMMTAFKAAPLQSEALILVVNIIERMAYNDDFEFHLNQWVKNCGRPALDAALGE